MFTSEPSIFDLEFPGRNSAFLFRVIKWLKGVERTGYIHVGMLIIADTSPCGVETRPLTGAKPDG